MAQNNFSRQPIVRISFRELIILFLIIALGISYIGYVFFSTRDEQKSQALQIALTAEAALPDEDVVQLNAIPSDTALIAYKRIKQSLSSVIRQNPKARFVYLYLLRDGKLFFMVDSEPENSPDLSPPGQEFTEAAPIDYQAIKTGQPQITQPVSDRWGTWVSIEVPVKEPGSGKTIAALGVDYNASSWNQRLFF